MGEKDCVRESSCVRKRVRNRNAMRRHGRIVGDIVRDRESSWEIECVCGRESGVCGKQSS